MRFSCVAADIATNAGQNTWRTMLALRAADTLGYRFRLRSLAISFSDDAPADLNVGVLVKRVDDVSAGGAGTANAALTPVPQDSQSRAAVITAGEDYEQGGVEPTVYGDPLWGIELNRRNGCIKEWSAEDAPVALRDQSIGILAAPRTAAAARMTITAEFEEF